MVATIGKLRYNPGGTVNFSENVMVKETKKPRWAKFSVVGRTSDLFAYAGAQSRVLTLTFNLTEPHHGSITEDLNTIRGGTTSGGGSAPTVKFSYGGMYQGIKCVCTNYSITNVETAGYTDGMVPRRVKVMITLEEVDIPNY